MNALWTHLDGLLSRGLTGWVGAVSHASRSVLLLVAVVTVALAGFTVRNLGVNMDTDAMIAQELPHQQRWRDFLAAFPMVADPTLVLIDAETPEDARSGARRLADRMRSEPQLFEDIYVPGEGPFFERNGLLYLTPAELENLADHLATVQPYLAELGRDNSLRGLFSLLGTAMEGVARGDATILDLAPIFDRLRDAVDSVRAGRPHSLSWEQVLLATPETGARPQSAILVQPRVDHSELIPVQAAIAAVHRLAAETGLDAAAGFRVRVTGELALSAEELEAVSEGSALAGVLSFVCVMGILFVGLRSVRLMAATCITLVIGLIWTAAFAAAAIGHLNMVSVAFAVLFIGLGVDFGIHFCLRYSECLAAGRSLDEGLRTTAVDVGKSLALCALTTSVGFYAFVPTEYEGVAELGLISGTGIFVSLFCSLTVLPALLTLWPLPTGAAPSRVGGDRLAFFLAFPVRHRRVTQVGAALLACAMLPLLPRVRFDHNPLNLRVPGTESVTAFNELLAERATSAWTLHVLAEDRDAADDLARRLEALGPVDYAITLSDYVPAEQETKLAILGDMALFVPETGQAKGDPPDPAVQLAAIEDFVATVDRLVVETDSTPEAASARGLRDALASLVAEADGLDPGPTLAQLETSLLGLFPEQLHRLQVALGASNVTAESLPRDLLGTIVASDGRVRVEAIPAESLAENVALARFVDEARTVSPDVTGVAVQILEAARAIVRALQQAFTYAVVLISLLLIVLWRRLGDVGLVLAPLFLASLLTAGASVILDIPFNFADVIVLPLLLGIGVDSGIHLVNRYRDVAGSAGLLRTSTARGVFFSGLTTIASFGTLGLSVHPGMASMGQLLTLGVAFTLLCNLILVPALAAEKRLPSDGI